VTLIGRVVSLSVKPETRGEAGLPKQVVASLLITPSGARGDFNRYRTQQLAGDPDSAILLLTEDILKTLHQEGWTIAPGDLGENVLLAGIAADQLRPGRRVRLGAALLEVTRPCHPCTELYLLPSIGRERGPEFVRTLQGRRGWYARVLEEGTVERGADAHVLG
jgi:MOSC domain-containing protein YiiM